MDGITILNIIPACDYIVMGWIAFGFLIASLGLFIAAVSAEWDDGLAGLFIAISVISLLLVVGSFSGTHAQRYEVSLSENKDMKEFLERYTVVEQRGQIYTVEDKA